MRSILLLIICITVNFKSTSQSLFDKLISKENVEFNKDLNFNLESILLFDYEIDYYSSRPGFEYSKNKFPEFLKPNEIVFEIFRSQEISQIDLRKFENNLFTISSSDYFKKYISPLSLNSYSGGSFKGNNFLYQIVSPSEKDDTFYDEQFSKKNNFGNQFFYFRLSLPSKTLTIPLIRINGGYKLIVDKFFLLEIFDIDITQSPSEIPMTTIYDGQVLNQQIGMDNITYYKRQNPNYFKDYKTRNDIFKVKRINTFNDKGIVKSTISRENIFFIFNLE